MQEGAKADPIVVEVVANYLTEISNEMSIALQRTSYNMMIYEVKDYCCTLLGANGDLWSQNVGGVSHFVADMGVIIRDGVKKYGVDGFSPGDVIIHNHQRVAGQHLNNIVTYAPIFFKQKLKAFSAVRAHWNDIGGMSTGWGSMLSHDAWEEGLQLNQVKLYDGGKLDGKVMDIIKDNLRTPEASSGDLRAQVASCRLAERLLIDLYGKYGEEVIENAIPVIFEQTDTKIRKAVMQFKEGTYESEGFLDETALAGGTGRIRIAAKVTLKGDGDAIVDFTGTSPQSTVPINSRSNAAANIPFKALTDPFGSVNEGSFRRLKIVNPEGTIMMARFPAPMGHWSLVLPMAVDVVLRALAPALPDRVPAAHSGEMGPATFFYGVNRDGKRFITQTGGGGGWGGRPFEDGPFPSGNICQGDVKNAPIETIELKQPILVEKRALRTDSGGPGMFRGGMGTVSSFRNLIDGYWTLGLSRRIKNPPWGIWGGKPGAPHKVTLLLPDKTILSGSHVEKLLSAEGALATIETTGGGGWGNPLERDPKKVSWDVLEGYVSIESARRDYGVILNSDMSPDLSATKELRAKLMREHST